MESIQNILETYAAADEEQRLSMYLTHRDLRRLFHKIEMTDWAQTQTASVQQPKSSGNGHRSGFFAGAWLGWLRYCRLPR